ncbi:polyprenyl synthetase family protein [Compostimonas suwonensis]|uniref:Geranylgeranyl diphosphate synthase type I n=1 Tax=Compostimonas suwonensis TaxID=1048394 RepID=A0A2M9BAY8_9MICO|nr:polyprenyl synthetase family protein [Compostimonas suwonensis]PJJ55103.1 geranylgeranyl diphosphate synthase type I [Compostimonas suwonensis]
MADSTRLVDLVQTRIDDFLEERDPIVASISTDLAPFLGFSRDFLSGGKRFRALFCYWGWQAVAGIDSEFDPFGSLEPAELDTVIDVASGLELFHAAALVHDDIIDNSDTRRGAPSAHRRFEGVHRDDDWSGDAAQFGTSAAILLGDLLLGWSDELVDEGLRRLGSPERAASARRLFNTMRTQVTAGQYLDIVEERAWSVHPEAELLERAQRVIVYKSAKYSVEAPLVIGAAIAGADEQQIAVLRAFGLPLGIAYQLRDDLLGVFGDAEVTGKPSGDDLREGKRTVLIALARQALPPGARRILDELLGDPALTAIQIQTLQDTIRHSGALETIEKLIARNVAEARAALDGAPLSRRSANQLLALAETVTRRTA